MGTPSTGMPSTGKPLTRALSTSLVPDLPGERPSRQRQALCAERPSPRKSFGSGPPRCPPHGEPWALPEALSSKSLGSGPPHCPSRGEPWALRRGPPHGEALPAALRLMDLSPLPLLPPQWRHDGAPAADGGLRPAGAGCGSGRGPGHVRSGILGRSEGRGTGRPPTTLRLWLFAAATMPCKLN